MAKVNDLNSNLGFVSNFELDIKKTENGYRLEFSTGFVVDATFLKKEDEVNIYQYPSKYNNEVNYLHEREDNDFIYFQTVQSGTSPGGSTFKIPKNEEYKLPEPLLKDMGNYYLYIFTKYTNSGNFISNEININQYFSGGKNSNIHFMKKISELSLEEIKSFKKMILNFNENLKSKKKLELEQLNLEQKNKKDFLDENLKKIKYPFTYYKYYQEFIMDSQDRHEGEDIINSEQELINLIEEGDFYPQDYEDIINLILKNQ